MLPRLDVETTPEAGPTGPPAAEAAPAARWSLPARVAFRFTFVYFGLYVLTTQMLGGLWIVPKIPPPDMGATGWMKGVVSWVARRVFHADYAFVTVTTGSGDRTVDWAHAAVLLAFAALATVVWSFLDRRRPAYPGLHKWFTVFLRFAAATTMLGYGWAKAVPLQMPAPGLARLLEPFGSFSPMGVLWYSVGASYGWEMFAGIMELTAAALLFVPQLATIGALVLFADAVQIFMLNMTYDVPVKLFAFHLIVIALVLLAPEIPRLVRVFVLNRTAGPSALPPLARRTLTRRILIAAQIMLGLLLFVTGYVESRQGWTQFGGGAPKSALYGIWNIEKMTIDGVERAPLLTDYARWRRVVFDRPTSMAFQRMDDTFTGYPVAIDADTHAIAVQKGTDKNWAHFAYQRPSTDTLVLDGELDGHTIRMETKLQPREDFLLIKTGFHWINERPFNR